MPILAPYELPRCTVAKKPPAHAGDMGSILGPGRFPGRKWQPALVFLPGESHGQRNLAGYNAWAPKEWDMTECAYVRARTHTHTHTHTALYKSVIFHSSSKPLMISSVNF